MIYRICSLLAIVAAASALQLPASCSTTAAARMPAAAARTAVHMHHGEEPHELAARASVVTMSEEAAAEEAAPAEPAAEAAKPAKKAKTPLEELVVGTEVEGKIRSVQTYGAFVDIGAATDALLHVSEIANEFIKDANEKLTAGETITCKIKGIDLEKQQLAITCKEPRPPRKPRVKVDLSKYEGADDKEFVTGKVNSITDFGAFVTLEEGVDGLVHISQVQEGGVGKVSDVLSEGQEVQVRVTSVDKSKRRIALSMLPWSEQSERKPRGGGGFGGDVGFGEADKEFQMSAEEVDAMAVGDAFSSPFEAAFERAALVQQLKSSKGKYTRQVL